ncbi:MAG: hypothetical protein LBQ11_01870 [Candidatus Nomurabacteria bacterium]|jgi:hypothetical protein|nr:hypothetical protein [Candidatus Nomurabacteria bacterium]
MFNKKKKRELQRSEQVYQSQVEEWFLKNKEIFEANKVALTDVAISCTTENDIVTNEILNHNKLHGQPIPELTGRWGGDDGYKKATQLLKIYEKDPETAGLLVKKNIAGFHATNSSTLLNVLQNGLLPASKLREQDEMITSGEHYYTGGKQRAVSFVDWREPKVIAEYAGINDDHYEKLSFGRIDHYISIYELQKDKFANLGADAQVASLGLMVKDLQRKREFLQSPSEADAEKAALIIANFPVAYGIDASGSESFFGVESHIECEFAVEEVTSSDIKVVAVPLGQIEYVKQLAKRFGHDNIAIIPIETITA